MNTPTPSGLATIEQSRIDALNALEAAAKAYAGLRHVEPTDDTDFGPLREILIASNTFAATEDALFVVTELGWDGNLCTIAARHFVGAANCIAKRFAHFKGADPVIVGHAYRLHENLSSWAVVYLDRAIQ